jgi:hypothetical protein
VEIRKVALGCEAGECLLDKYIHLKPTRHNAARTEHWRQMHRKLFPDCVDARWTQKEQ